MASIIPKLQLDIATRALRREFSDVQKFVTNLRDQAPDCAPSRFRFNGSRWFEFDLSDLVSSQKNFISSFEWKNKESNVTGHLITQFQDVPSSVMATFQPLRWKQEKIIQAAVSLFQVAQSDMAFLHGFTESERQHLRDRDLVINTDRAATNWIYGVPARRLRFGLPDLAWLNIFGPVYIQHFGRDRLLSAPAFSTREVRPSVIVLQLTDHYEKIGSDWYSFNATRENVIDHLGRDSFQRVRGPSDPPAAMGPGIIYNEGIPAQRVPDFGF